jgi:DNA-binding transcriptional MocR family regulator
MAATRGRRTSARSRAPPRKRQVGIYPVSPCYLKPPKTAGLLLGYGGLTELEIRDGVGILGEVIASL